MTGTNNSVATFPCSTLKGFCAAVTLGSASLLSGNAAANAITGGITEVTLDPVVAGSIIGLGVNPEATGTATFTDPTFTFPITGGNTEAGTTIEHDGSGIQFSAGVRRLDIGDFVIDVIDSTTATIFGDASSTEFGDVPGAALFDLAKNDGDSLYSVALTGTAAFALNTTFGVDNFAEGQAIGSAVTKPELAAVPAPATLSILAIGLAAVGWNSGARKRAAQA